jgi:cellulose synthase/poly-beta-1,6-N-acetylglucosamine synthase-like glycosyltransferase
MGRFLLKLISSPIIAILLIFNLRRLIFTLTILLSGKAKEQEYLAIQKYLPDVLILVPCRDEAAMIASLCQAIDQIDYPRNKLQVVLVDDGSTDETGEKMRENANEKPGWYVLSLPKNTGKANALNAALDQFQFGEIIYIFDADHRPDPSAINNAVRYFDDPRVAGVTGYTKIANPTASPSAYYSTVESSVNQLVTMRAKDRLRLAPALLGSNCGYRRIALEECGGFRMQALSEDSDLTVTFYQSGNRVRFAEDAISYQQVPQSVRGYLRQHVRWGRGLNDVARMHGLDLIRDSKLRLPLRIELLIFSSGYLDRLALAGAALLAALSFVRKDLFRFPLSVLSFALLMPLVQVVALFSKEKASTSMWARLPLIPLFFLLDIYAAARSMLESLFNPSREWTKTERVTLHHREEDQRLYR